MIIRVELDTRDVNARLQAARQVVVLLLASEQAHEEYALEETENEGEEGGGDCNVDDLVHLFAFGVKEQDGLQHV